MCGICGIATFHDTALIDDSILQHMNDAIARRGPDDEGIYNCGNIALGSRRLSIIDLAGGHQPITNEDESMWIVFNGEIYNYRELREYLVKRQHNFRTATDTEVILHLYEEFGADSVQHLNGIFAFAIWDMRRNQVFIARDRLGIKPLYYTTVNNTLIFASEMKSLLAHPNVPREIDLISLNEYLTFEYVPTPRTILRDIWRLEPGCTLLYGAEGMHIEPYWNLSLARSESRPPVHWRDYSEALYSTLQNSVKQELVSDVPVGVLLSGGLDSSTIAALMTHVAPGKVNSFTIGFEDGSFDESVYAKRVSQHLGTDHHELILTGKVAADLIGSITDFLDEPFADSSLIPTYFLSRFARDHVKVVLGGDGGDELFAGYPTFIAHRAIEYYERLIPWHLRAYFAPRILKMLPVSFNNISLDFKIRRFLSGHGNSLQARHQGWLGSFTEEQKDHLLRSWIKPVLRDTFAQSYSYALSCDAQHPLNKLLYNDMKLYLEGDILYKVDRASMAASLEVRVPMLNRNVVDFATSLPLSLKLNGITGKYLLKKTMERDLPKDIVWRGKKGFNMPVARWLNGDLRDLMGDVLGEKYINTQGLFDFTYVQQLRREHATEKTDHRKVLWTLLMFQLWYDRYIA